MRNVPVKLISISLFHSSTDVSTVDLRKLIPALLTNISICPKWFFAFSTREAAVAGKLASPVTETARVSSLFREEQTSCNSTSFVPFSTTLAPSKTNASAMARPIPLLAPVMIATLFCKVIYHPTHQS
ncbi:hypothetical protein C883_3418 [Bacillus stratosphericus LAMA 585]|nr:hypothetical protein C883_3418 [Bacillus stratosphericus LAMA 585]